MSSAAGSSAAVRMSAIHRDINNNMHSFDPVSFGSDGSSDQLSYNFSSQHVEIVGTLNYMSPEALGAFAERALHQKIPVCTAATDWFSLGVVVHEMLVGAVPFRGNSGMNYRRVHKIYSANLRNSKFDLGQAYEATLGRFEPTEDNKPLMGTDGHSLIAGLLDLDPLTRLGINKCNLPTGDVHGELKNHPFFTGIDWDQAEAHKLSPPSFQFFPTAFACTHPFSCKEMLEFAGKSSWVDGAPLPHERTLFHRSSTLTIPAQAQHYFRNWCLTNN